MNSGPARASVVTAIIGVVVGLALAVVGVVHVVREVVHTVNTPALTLPAHVEKQLDTGDYDIYQQTGTSSGGGGFTFSQRGPVTLTPADVSVTAPDGSRLGVGQPSVSETLTRNGDVFTAAVRFSVLQSGIYVIDIRQPFGGAGSSQVIITKSFGTIARGALRWVLLVVAGGLIALTSMVVLIVVFVRSRRQSLPTAGMPAYAGAPPALAPPGWYPDPSGQAPHRWWDGSRWTDHTG